MKSVFTRFLLSSFMLVVTGCATSPMTESSKRDDVAIEKVSSRKGEVGNTQVYQQGDATVVKGSIRRKTTSRILDGHVHVELYNKENTLLDRITTSYRLRKNGSQVAGAAKFQAVLESPVPPDSRIEVEHHDSSDAHQDTGTLSVE